MVKSSVFGRGLGCWSLANNVTAPRVGIRIKRNRRGPGAGNGKEEGNTGRFGMRWDVLGCVVLCCMYTQVSTKQLVPGG